MWRCTSSLMFSPPIAGPRPDQCYLSGVCVAPPSKCAYPFRTPGSFCVNGRCNGWGGCGMLHNPCISHDNSRIIRPKTYLFLEVKVFLQNGTIAPGVTTLTGWGLIGTCQVLIYRVNISSYHFMFVSNYPFISPWLCNTDKYILYWKILVKYTIKMTLSQEAAVVNGTTGGTVLFAPNNRRYDRPGLKVFNPSTSLWFHFY